MEERSAVKTVGYVTGIGVLLLVLFLVACITTGILPWRDSYSAEVPPSGDDTVIVVPTSTPTPAPTPIPQITETPVPEESPEPSTAPTPAPTPTPGVTLDEELPTYIVTVTFGRGGKAIPYGMSKVVENGSITITAIPNEGYSVENMILDGVSLGAVDSYTLENMSEDHSFYISFVRSAVMPTPTPAPTPTATPSPTPVPTPVPTPAGETQNDEEMEQQ